MKNAPVHKAKFSNMIKCIFFITTFVPAFTYAQTRGTVEVVKDARIDTFIARRSGLKVNRAVVAGSSTAAPVYVPTTGYRVQIFSGSARKDAYEAQARFQQEYPNLRTYISYHEPYFKVHAGDFRTRLEAEKLVQELRKAFTSLFIIQEKINPPKADVAND
jgi:hypothetical protein